MGTEVDLTLTSDSSATSLQISRSTDGVTFTQIYSGGVIGSYADTAVAPDTIYYYQATNADTNGTSDDADGNVTTGPAAPSVSAGGTGSGEIDLTISADSTTASMQITRNRTQIYTGSVVTSYHDTGLPADNSYTYTVTTSNSNGSSSASADGTTGPSVPSVAAMGISGSEIDLAIGADSTAASMQILRDGSQIYTGSPVSSYADDELSPDESHSYTVTISNANGSASGLASGTTGPDDPTISAVANSNGTEIDLTLTADSTATAMLIFRDGTQIYTGGIITTYSDAGLTADSSHTYVVTTSNINGSSSASTSAGTAPSVPSVTATANGNSEIDLAITADPSATSMQILRNGTQIYNAGVMSSFADSGLLANSSFTYTIITGNSNGSSSCSTDASTGPSNPSVAATANGSSEIDLAITYDLSATSMQILRNGTQIYNFTPIGTYADNGLPADSAFTYTVTISNSFGSANGYADGNTGPTDPTVTATTISGSEIDLAITPDYNATSMQILRNGTQIYDAGVIGTYSDTGLAADSTFTYLVITSNSYGTSGGSTTGSTGLTNPTVTAAGVSGHEIDLTITSDPNAATMVINRDGTQIYSGAPVGTYADDMLTPDGEHDYTVTTSNSVDSSSGDATGTTGPADPTIVATANGSTEIDLVLTSDSTATNMQILRNGSEIYNGSPITTRADTGLPADSSNSYTVITSNSNGSSSASTSAGTGPSEPSVTATGVSGTEVDLSITFDTSATTMTIYRDSTQIYNAGPVATVADIGLDPDTSYDYTVITGNSSGSSNGETTGTTGPAAPTVTATSGGSSVINVAIGADSTATTMQILRNGTQIYSGIPVTTYPDAGLPADSSNTYTVVTGNSNGSSSASSSATTGPSDPIVVAGGVSGTEIDLAIAADSSATTMVIKRDGTQIYSGIPVGTYADGGLTPDSDHEYAVTTSNSNGTSSGDDSGTTGPADPTITATANGSDEIDLVLTSDSTATHMQILRNGTEIYSGSPITSRADTGLPADSSNTYVVITSNDNGSSSASTSADTGPYDPTVTAEGVSATKIDLTITFDPNVASMQIYRGSTQVYNGDAVEIFHDTGLSPLTTYSYTVTTSNENGSSSADADGTTTGNEITSVTIDTDPVEAPIEGMTTFKVIIDGSLYEAESVTITQSASLFTSIVETGDSWDGTPSDSETLTYEATAGSSLGTETITATDDTNAGIHDSVTGKVGLPDITVAPAPPTDLVEHTPFDEEFGTIDGFVSNGALTYAADVIIEGQSYPATVDGSGNISAGGDADLVTALDAYSGSTANATVSATVSGGGLTPVSDSQDCLAAVADAPLTLAGDSPSGISGIVGQSITATLLHFTDADPEAELADYTATVQWGDSSSDSSDGDNVTIAADPAGGFDIVGTHAYVPASTYSVSVHVADDNGAVLDNTLTATIGGLFLNPRPGGVFAPVGGNISGPIGTLTTTPGGGIIRPGAFVGNLLLNGVQYPALLTGDTDGSATVSVESVPLTTAGTQQGVLQVVPAGGGPGLQMPLNIAAVKLIAIPNAQDSDCGCGGNGVSEDYGYESEDASDISDGEESGGVTISDAPGASASATYGIAGNGTVLQDDPTLAQAADGAVVVIDDPSSVRNFQPTEITDDGSGPAQNFSEGIGGHDTFTYDLDSEEYTLKNADGTSETFGGFMAGAGGGLVVSKTDNAGNPTYFVYDSTPTTQTFGSYGVGAYGPTNGNFDDPGVFYFVKIAYVDSSGATIAGASTEVDSYLNAGQRLNVLSPPPMYGAVGYNVYAAAETTYTIGDNHPNFRLQNSSPVAIGAIWTEPTGSSGGIVTTGAVPPAAGAGHLVEKINPVATGGETTLNEFVYNYDGDRLASVDLNRENPESSSFVNVEETDYSYDDANNLFSAITKNADGSTLDSQHYFYYSDGKLKYDMGRHSFDRFAGSLPSGVTAQTATDAEIAPYADDYYAYDSQGRVVTHTMPNSGNIAATYTPSENPLGYNSWASKTTYTTPNGTVDVTYFNGYNQKMLQVTEDPVSGRSYGTFTEYDDQGRVILSAQPSAVLLPPSLTTLEGYADLLDSNGETYEYLSSDSGQITLTDYYGATTATESTPGGVAGYVQDTKLENGQLGTPVLQESEDYFAHSGGGTTVYPVADDVTYGVSDSDTRTTSYDYVYYANSTQVEVQTTTLPVVSSAQNGPNVADTSIAVFDINGRTIWTRDGNGSISYTAYDDATGAVIESIADVNYSLLTTDQKASFDSFTSLTGWSHPTGLNLVTTYEVDSQGRTTKMTDPDGNITYTVYDDANQETRVYPGFDPTTGTTTGPIQITQQVTPDANSGDVSYTQTLTSSATPHLTDGVPDGTETIDASNIQSLSRQFTNAAGQEMWSDQYVDFTGVTYSPAVAMSSSDSDAVPVDLGTNGVNYYRTTFGYDSVGNQNHVVTPNGTITDTVYDGMGRVVSTWIGTDDTPPATTDNPDQIWSPANNDSPSNMIEVQSQAYDTQSAPTAPTLFSTTPDDGDALAAATYYVKVSYIINGVDTAGSLESSIAIAARDLLSVLTPAGATDATAYNVYVGASPGSETLQNSSPITLGTNWTEEPTGVTTDGAAVPLDGVGDSNATETIEYPGHGQAPRISQTFYDWRDRAVESEAGVSATDTTTPRSISYTIYDNQGEVTEQDTYNGTAIQLSALGATDGVPNAPGSSELTAESTAAYDNQGRPYETQTFSVDPATDTVSSTALTTNVFYDHNGQTLAVYTTGRPTTKTVYDSAGRVIAQYATDGGAVNNSADPGTPLMNWSDAGSVFNDIVISETDTTYDPDGNTILTVSKDRLTTDSNSDTGALGTPSTGVQSRDSYATAYYDAAGRTIAQADFGTTAVSAPTDDTASGVPTRSDSVLVSSMTYNPAGEVDTTTDPRGIVAKTTYDMLGQTTETIAAYTDGVPTDDTNQTTDYTYDGDGNQTSMTAVMPTGQNSQTTDYVYGIGATIGTDLFSNDMLTKTEYPDPSTGAASASAANDVSATYDNLGETLTTTDQNGTTHTYSYDSLGRMTLDVVTTLGTGVDGSVMALGYSFNSLGLPYQQTSYSDAAGTTVVNQDQDVYNGLQELIGEYQAVSGTVDTSSTPEVQYVYSDPGEGSLLTEMIYPNGRILHYGYGNNALDAAIGRVDFLADDNGSGGVGAHDADYAYQGLSTLVQQADGNGITENISYDQFGNIADLNWLNTSTDTSTDHFQYGHDRDGKVLYKDNLLNSSFSELYHANSATTGDDNSAYDPLNRLTGFSRGTLSASSHNGGTLDTVATLNSIAGASQSFALNAVGDQTSVTTDGTTTDRAANSQNELTGYGSATLAYDNDGNTTTDENGNTLTYDAWNRLASDSVGSTSYAYDANGRRISETHSSTTNNVYFDSQGQALEERETSSNTIIIQEVWNIGYLNDLLLRDDNSTSGSLGTSGSGLGERIYPQNDASYNITALTDASGNVVERFIYTSYGTQAALTAGWMAVSGWTESADMYHWLYYFQGGRQDSSTGLIHFGYRDYDSMLQRWIQADPSGYADSMNVYQSFDSSPIALFDPSGLEPATKPAQAEQGKLTYFDGPSVDGEKGLHFEARWTLDPKYAGAVFFQRSSIVKTAYNKDGKELGTRVQTTIDLSPIETHLLKDGLTTGVDDLDAGAYTGDLNNFSKSGDEVCTLQDVQLREWSIADAVDFQLGGKTVRWNQDMGKGQVKDRVSVTVLNQKPVSAVVGPLKEANNFSVGVLLRGDIGVFAVYHVKEKTVGSHR